MKEQQSGTMPEARVTLFCFLLTVLVVYVHAPNIGLTAGGMEPVPGSIGAFFAEAEQFFSGFVGAAAVPGFFFLSAMRFFQTFARSETNGAPVFREWRAAMSVIFVKWKRRLRSLLLPYLLWNGVYYLVYVLAGRVPLRPDTAFAGILNYAFNPVFWYMKQLMILTLLAPVIYLLVCRRGLRFAALGVSMYLAVFYDRLPFHIVNEDALFYYMVGAVYVMERGARLQDDKERKTDLNGVQKVELPLCAVLLAVCGMLSWSAQNGQAAFGHIYIGRNTYLAATIAFRICLPYCLWQLLGLLRLQKGSLPPVIGISFFVYAMHFLIVRGLNHVLIGSAPQDYALLFIAYLLLPAISFGLCYVLFLAANRICPRLYGLFTGGR